MKSNKKCESSNVLTYEELEAARKIARKYTNNIFRVRPEDSKNIKALFKSSSDVPIRIRCAQIGIVLIVLFFLIINVLMLQGTVTLFTIALTIGNLAMCLIALIPVIKVGYKRYEEMV